MDKKQTIIIGIVGCVISIGAMKVYDEIKARKYRRESLDEDLRFHKDILHKSDDDDNE